MSIHRVAVIGDGSDDNPRRPLVGSSITWECIEDQGTHMVIEIKSGTGRPPVYPGTRRDIADTAIRKLRERSA